MKVAQVTESTYLLTGSGNCIPNLYKLFESYIYRTVSICHPKTNKHLDTSTPPWLYLLRSIKITYGVLLLRLYSIILGWKTGPLVYFFNVVSLAFQQLQYLINPQLLPTFLVSSDWIISFCIFCWQKKGFLQQRLWKRISQQQWSAFNPLSWAGIHSTNSSTLVRFLLVSSQLEINDNFQVKSNVWALEL